MIILADDCLLYRVVKSEENASQLQYDQISQWAQT